MKEDLILSINIELRKKLYEYEKELYSYLKKLEKDGISNDEVVAIMLNAILTIQKKTIFKSRGIGCNRIKMVNGK